MVTDNEIDSSNFFCIFFIILLCKTSIIAIVVIKGYCKDGNSIQRYSQAYGLLSCLFSCKYREIIYTILTLSP